MWAILAAVLLAGAVLAFWASSAEALCGPGCHISLSAACVVDGWGTVRNECPVPSRPVPQCPRGMSWRHGACMPQR